MSICATSKCVAIIRFVLWSIFNLMQPLYAEFAMRTKRTHARRTREISNRNDNSLQLLPKNMTKIRSKLHRLASYVYMQDTHSHTYAETLEWHATCLNVVECRRNSIVVVFISLNVSLRSATKEKMLNEGFVATFNTSTINMYMHKHGVETKYWIQFDGNYFCRVFIRAFNGFFFVAYAQLFSWFRWCRCPLHL